MAWSDAGDGVTLDGEGVSLTSTSTMVLTSMPLQLRMFADTLAPALHQTYIAASVTASTVTAGDFQHPAPTSPHVRTGSGLNVGFIDSQATSVGIPEFAVSSTSLPLVYSTSVPSRKEVLLPRFVIESYDATGAPAHGWDPMAIESSPYHARYKDVDVVALGDGRGRLMLMARVRRLVEDGNLDRDTQATPETSYGDIVAYWAPEDDPGFEGPDVRGPFWLVNSLNAVPDFPLVRFWLGVPSGVVGSEGTDEYLYLYYMVEGSRYNYGTTMPDTTGFIPGVYLKKIVLSDLLDMLERFYGVDEEEEEANVIVSGTWYDRDESFWGQLALQNYMASTLSSSGFLAWKVERGSRRHGAESDELPTAPDVPVLVEDSTTSSGADATDEATWDEMRGVNLAPGVLAGRVRVWMVSDWPSGPELLDRYNIRSDAPTVKTADPAATSCDDALVLFFSTISEPSGGGLEDVPDPYGVWRSYEAPSTSGAVRGTEFVVADADSAGVIADQLLGSATGPDDAPAPQYLDPDPVQSPVFSGGWAVFVGNMAGAMVRMEGKEADGCNEP